MKAYNFCTGDDKEDQATKVGYFHGGYKMDLSLTLFDIRMPSWI